MRTRGRIGVFLSVALLIALGGCGGTVKQAKPQSVGTHVFTEVKDQQPPLEGTVDLRIKASIKTPIEGHYLFGSRTPPQGKDGYPFELNINGQEIVWKVEGKEEITPLYDENGRRLPEGGQGIRYVLNKKIQLKSGPHHIMFGLPHEDYYTEVKVSLKESEPHTLEFRPVYAMGRRGVHTFHHGIKTYEAFLDGNQIK
jgi:hypothetical protein